MHASAFEVGPFWNGRCATRKVAREGDPSGNVLVAMCLWGGQQLGQWRNPLNVVAERVGRLAWCVIGGGKSTSDARSLFRRVGRIQPMPAFHSLPHIVLGAWLQTTLSWAGYKYCKYCKYQPLGEAAQLDPRFIHLDSSVNKHRKRWMSKEQASPAWYFCQGGEAFR